MGSDSMAWLHCRHSADYTAVMVKAPGDKPELAGGRPGQVGDKPEPVDDMPERVGDKPGQVGDKPELEADGRPADGTVRSGARPSQKSTPEL
jgi:hypothetical protein